MCNSGQRHAAARGQRRSGRALLQRGLRRRHARVATDNRGAGAGAWLLVRVHVQMRRMKLPTRIVRRCLLRSLQHTDGGLDSAVAACPACCCLISATAR